VEGEDPREWVRMALSRRGVRVDGDLQKKRATGMRVSCVNGSPEGSSNAFGTGGVWPTERTYPSTPKLTRGASSRRTCRGAAPIVLRVATDPWVPPTRLASGEI